MVVLNHPFGGGLWEYPVPASLASTRSRCGTAIGCSGPTSCRSPSPTTTCRSTGGSASSSRAGARRAAVGGSDNHWRSTFALQGVGQPTTWVYAADRSPAAIINAVQAGRTTVSWQPPAYAGPQLTITATELYGTQRQAIVGGEVRPLGPTGVTVRVRNGLGHRLRIVSAGQVVGNYLVLPVPTSRTPPMWSCPRAAGCAPSCTSTPAT